MDKSGYKTGFWKALAHERTLHFMILPTLVSMIVFHYFSMFGIVLAFQRFDIVKGFLHSPWASGFGFEHFIDFFTRTPGIANLFINTICISLLKLIFLSLPPVILAVMFNELPGRAFKRIAQSVSYLPYFISWVVIAGLIYVFFLPTADAPVNAWMLKLGLIENPIEYLNQRIWMWPILVLSEVWKEVGFASIIYVAVITGIDPGLYEAVEIDGGGRWKKIRHITLPSLTGTFVILLILACGRIMSSVGGTFEQVYVLGNALNYDFIDIFSTYILRVGLEGNRLSFAAAVGLFQSVVNMLLLLSANRISKALSGNSLY